jgi:hypothetical protein
MPLEHTLQQLAPLGLIDLSPASSRTCCSDMVIDLVLKLKRQFKLSSLFKKACMMCKRREDRYKQRRSYTPPTATQLIYYLVFEGRCSQSEDK